MPIRPFPNHAAQKGQIARIVILSGTFAAIRL
jgi:hypothetical protein